MYVTRCFCSMTMMGDIKKALAVRQGCSLLIDQREARQAKSELFIWDQYGQLTSEGSQAFAWDSKAQAVFLQPLHPSETLRVRKMRFRTPRNCAWRSGVKVRLSHASCKRKAKAGPPCGEMGVGVRVPLSTFFLSLSSTIPILGGDGGADILGKLAGL